MKGCESVKAVAEDRARAAAREAASLHHVTEQVVGEAAVVGPEGGRVILKEASEEKGSALFSLLFGELER